MRPLNLSEQDTLERFASRINGAPFVRQALHDFRIQVSYQGNFTIVRLACVGVLNEGLGAAKRRTDDPWNPQVGVNIALCRALKHLIP